MKLVFELVVEDRNVKTEIEKAKRTVNDLNKAFKESKEGTQEYHKLAGELGAAKAKLGELTDEQKRLNREFKALSVPRDSLAGMRIEYAKMTELATRFTAVERQSETGKRFIARANALKNEINAAEESLGRFTGSVGNYKKALLSIGDIVTAGLLTGGIVGAIDLVAGAVVKGVTAFTDYEKKLDNLSALTGVTGDELLKFKDKADELTNIKLIGADGGTEEIKNTGADILEAFKLVGGAQPELLKSADALAEVTIQAIILSAASGDDLVPSVEAVTTTLGQFNLTAADSGRVTNELAAGAKVGASEITDTKDALARFGTTASAVNVTTGESIALIQTLAEKQLKGADAGTALRNILAKIASADVLPPNAIEALESAGVNIDILKDKSLPLGERLKEIGKLAGDTSRLVKVFGLEGLNAATILAGSVYKFEAYKAGIEGTNEATIQAATNTGNLATAFEGLKVDAVNTAREAFEDMAPAVGVVIEAVGQLVGLLGAVISFLFQLPSFVKENKEAFAGLATGLFILNAEVIGFNAGMLLAAARSRIMAAATTIATVATHGLSAAMRANPVGAVITAVSFLVLGFKALYDRSETVRESIAGLGAVAKEIFAIVKEAVGSFIQGFTDLKNGDFSSAFKNLGDAFVKSNPITVALTQGKRLKEAFNKGFSERKLEEVEISASKAKSASTAGQTKVDGKTTPDSPTDPFDPKADSKNEKARNEAEKAEREHQTALEAQLKRTLELKKAIRDIDAGGIVNEFDRQLTELENKRAESLEKIAQARAVLAEKIAGQNGKLSEADAEETALIAENEASQLAAFNDGRAKIQKAREKAAADQLELAKSLNNEVAKLAADNAERLAALELKTVQDRIGNQLAAAEAERETRRLANDEQFSSGIISAKEYRRETLAIEAAYHASELEIRTGAANELRALNDAVLLAKQAAIQTELEAQLAAIKKAKDAEIEALRQKAKTQGVNVDGAIESAELAAIEKASAAKIAATDAERAAIEANKNANIDAQAAVRDAQAKTHEDALEQVEKEKEKRKELKDFLISAAAEVSDAIFSIEKNRLENEVEQKTDSLDVEFEKKKEAAAGNADELKKLDAEYQRRKTQLEKEAARERRRIAIIEAVIQGALAVVKALPNPFLAAAAGIATAAQIAVMSSQKLERGGKVGLFGGRPHSAGGTKGYFEDGTAVEVERDELFVVLNKRASAQIQSLSSFNARHGGAKFATGGAFDFTPQIALPGASQQKAVIQVNTVSEFSDEQIEKMAERLATRTGEAAKESIGQGLNDATRRAEREGNLAQNRSV